MDCRHVLCLYPHFDDPALWPALGLDYVATAAKQVAQDVELVDLRYVQDYREYIRPDTDAIAVSFNWPRHFDFVTKIINHIPRTDLLVVGGRVASFECERILEDCPNVDVIVRGEGEATIQDLLKAEGLHQVDGVSYRANGRVVHRPNREMLPIGKIGPPDRSLRVKPYAFVVDGVDPGVRLDTMLTSRGCPYKCKFCTFDTNPLGQKRTWAARDPEDVVDEIESMDADVIFFNDDNFMFDARRVERICDLLIARGIKKAYGGETRIDCTKHPEVLAKMYQAGFRMLGVGVEAIDDDTLQEMNRGYTVKDVEEAFAVLREVGILTVGFYIAGWFGQTREDIVKIADFSHECGIDFVCPSIIRYEPYSGMDELLAKYPNYHVSESRQVYSDELSAVEIQGATREMKARFYTPRQYAQILRKAWRGGLFHPKWDERWWQHPLWSAKWATFLPRVMFRKLKKVTGRARKKRPGLMDGRATLYGALPP